MTTSSIRPVRYTRLLVSALLFSALIASLPACVRIEETLPPLPALEMEPPVLYRGSQFPSITLKRITDRAATQIPSRDSQFTLIHFWATWCAQCVHELPAVRRLARYLSPHGIQVIGVAVDEDEGLPRSLALRLGLDFPNVHDPFQQAQHLYQAYSLPETVLIDHEGRLVSLIDPFSGQPVDKVVGARPWDDPRYSALLIGALERLPK